MFLRMAPFHVKTHKHKHTLSNANILAYTDPFTHSHIYATIDRTPPPTHTHTYTINGHNHTPTHSAFSQGRRGNNNTTQPRTWVRTHTLCCVIMKVLFKDTQTCCFLRSSTPPPSANPEHASTHICVHMHLPTSTAHARTVSTLEVLSERPRPLWEAVVDADAAIHRPEALWGRNPAAVTEPTEEEDMEGSNTADPLSLSLPHTQAQQRR